MQTSRLKTYHLTNATIPEEKGTS